MALKSCFKQTGPRPDDCVEPTVGPPCSPLTEPERDDAESAGTLSTGKAAGDASISANEAPSSRTLSQHSSSSSTLSGDDELALPSMIPKGRDSLCARPSDIRRCPMETIVPGQLSRYHEHMRLKGTETVRRQMHVLSDEVDQHPRAHRVGVHPPWAPNALTPACVRKAHVDYAARWFEWSAKSPLALPLGQEQGLGDVSIMPVTPVIEDFAGLSLSPKRSDSPKSLRAECASASPPPPREILHADVKEPFPIGPAAGEEFIIPDGPLSWTARLQHPSRPIGAFDPAERVYYAHQKCVQYLKALIDQGRSEADAIATVEHVLGGDATWGKLCDQAETAEHVLRVDGKLSPLPEWKAEADAADRDEGDEDDALPSPKPKDKGGKKPAPKAKGKGKASAPAEGEAGPSRPPAGGYAVVHSPSSCDALPADEEPAHGTKRVRRECKPSQKAKEIAEASSDFVQDECEGSPASKRRRQ